MEMILNYVKPELIVVAIVLYFIGQALKKSNAPDKYIPLILGGIGILLAMLYVIATSSLVQMQDVLMAVFTSIVQGILLAGLSTYANQIWKQLNKEE